MRPDARPSTAVSGLARSDFDGYLAECLALAKAEMRTFVPSHQRFGPILYDLVFIYPLRAAKGLRPALCLSTLRALGGRLHAGLRSAAMLEMYHNAFLIHDDVEDASERRRDGPTLHLLHGVPVAVNVADAMLALCRVPLRDNMKDLGLGVALRIEELVTRMTRESVEGQALELSWVAGSAHNVRDADYVLMVRKKTAWYSFIAPMLIGAAIAGATSEVERRLGRFATLLGVAFQIQDDILNLTGEEGHTGKNALEDIWEGKHTLMLIHVLRAAPRADAERVRAILKKRRPAADNGSPLRAIRSDVAEAIATARHRGGIDEVAARAVLDAVDRAAIRQLRTRADIDYIFELMRRHGSIDYARKAAWLRAEKARTYLDGLRPWMPQSVHLEFLASLVDYAFCRER